MFKFAFKIQVIKNLEKNYIIVLLLLVCNDKHMLQEAHFLWQLITWV